MPNHDSFESFLLDKKENEPNPFSAPQRLENWLASLNRLYDQIDVWLNPFYQKGLIVAGKKKINLFEEFIGSYEASKMELYIGKNIITIKPVGSLIVGSYGRVDIIGPLKDITIVEKEWNKWQVSLNHPRKRYIQLTKTLLQIVIEDVTNGTSKLEQQ